MKKLASLLLTVNFITLIFAQVSPVLKSTNTPTKSVTQVKNQMVQNFLKMPDAWFRSDMDKNKVIGAWMPTPIETVLVNDDYSGYSENVNYAMKSLVFYPDLSEGELVAYYVTPMERGHDANSSGFTIQKINLQEAANYKKVNWRIEPQADGSITLLSLRYKAYLSLQNSAQGQVTGQLIDSARVTDPMKIKFVFYRTGRTVNTPIAIYHPATKTFLNVESNPSFSSYRRDEFSALGSRTQKLPVRFIGTTAPMAWGMGDVFSLRNFFRFTAPGIGPDQDGDGHKAPDCNGDDCDDNDANRFPGNREKADANGHDEDCECNFELVDKDGDGFYDINSFNICRDGSRKAGTDCDDNNAAIRPGAMIFISASEAEICGRGKVSARTGMKFIRQQNGTALEVAN